MNKTIKNIVNISQSLENEIPLILQDTILELKKLIENDSIVSFSFLNNDVYFAQEKPIYVSVTTEEFSDIRLGLFGSMSEIEKAKQYKLPKPLKKTLENLNSTLFILNEHFSKKLPSIKNRSYFSIKAVNKEGAFANEVFDLLPNFQFNSQPTKKKKLK